MAYKAKNVLLSIVAAATILASIILTLMMTLHPSSVGAQTAISATDYTAPVASGFPWGTAFDGTGRVWVALPGCDLAPSCPSSTPPGKLALFDPNALNWATVVSLPAGYGQPLFVAVDHTG